jgi:hypothetical protein
VILSASAQGNHQYSGNDRGNAAPLKQIHPGLKNQNKSYLNQDKIAAPANRFADVGIQMFIDDHQEVNTAYAQYVSQYEAQGPVLFVDRPHFE